MSKAKLTYFGVRGRAETARLMLEDAGVDYENRFVTMEEWPKIKMDFKFGQLPVYSDEHYTIEESQAICGYLARRLNLLPQQEKDLIRHDQVTSLVATAVMELFILFWNPEFQKKKDEMRNTRLPVHLGHLEKFYSETTGPYWLGKDIHFADFQTWFYLDNVRMFSEETLRAYPGLMKFKKTFESRPRINAYLHSDRRPKSFTVPMAPFGGQNDDWRPDPISPS